AAGHARLRSLVTTLAQGDMERRDSAERRDGAGREDGRRAQRKGLPPRGDDSVRVATNVGRVTGWIAHRGRDARRFRRRQWHGARDGDRRAWRYGVLARLGATGGPRAAGDNRQSPR